MTVPKHTEKPFSAANPEIMKISDRWHLLKHLFDASKKILFSIIPVQWIPSLKGSERVLNPPITEKPIRKPDKVRLQNEENKWLKIQEIKRLRASGCSISFIARKLCITRNTVYAYLDTKHRPSGRRNSRFNHFRPLVRSLIGKGKSVKQIEDACRKEGFTGSLATLNSMASEERRKEKSHSPPALHLQQKVLHLLWSPPETKVNEKLDCLHPQFAEAFPDIFELYRIIGSFRQLIAEKRDEDLAGWIHTIRKQGLALFAPLLHRFCRICRQC
ncbi:helix-turn-helix domain-containing protein [Domibacillus sp. A3M-37]|uniref:helix-turn-helix domain-containing protein n=1 Tax=Domibacillus sp. A3M-37 TaxID=2962037 RepID=UPI0020B7990A|nr:helix-turn-helix domain-containing protein [Domibacillus sp. A3M-37]MCP3764538.1 helix-turn-helix domain-containing protein [Domibacillus sp. A3M-37]